MEYIARSPPSSDTPANESNDFALGVAQLSDSDVATSAAATLAFASDANVDANPAAVSDASLSGVHPAEILYRQISSSNRGISPHCVISKRMTALPSTLHLHPMPRASVDNPCPYHSPLLPASGRLDKRVLSGRKESKITDASKGKTGKRPLVLIYNNQLLELTAASEAASCRLITVRETMLDDDLVD